MNSILIKSTAHLLHPLIRIMLRNGISSGSMEKLIRKVYVDEAFSLSDKQHKKITISSISAQTGLSRKEVKHLYEQKEIHNVSIDKKFNRAIRIITGWTNDKGFTDTQGNPLLLNLEDKGSSFALLVKKYSGDIPTKAMLDLLINSNTVVLFNKQVKLVKHAYVPSNDSSNTIQILGIDTSEMISTIDHNLTAENEKKRFQRKVSSIRLNKNLINVFKQMVNEKAQYLLEELDAWLSKNEVHEKDESACYVSIGIYYYQ